MRKSFSLFFDWSVWRHKNAINCSEILANGGDGGSGSGRLQNICSKWQHILQSEHILALQFTNVFALLFDVVVDVLPIQSNDGQFDDDAILCQQLPFHGLIRTIYGCRNIWGSFISQLSSLTIHVNVSQLSALFLCSAPIYGIFGLFSGFYLLRIIFLNSFYKFYVKNN